jgi:di/tricarboxylate transporter
MNSEALTVFGILGLAVVLFLTNRLRPDVVAVLVLVALAATGIVKTEEALAGFGSSAVVTIAALLVISAALVRTGVVLWIAEQLQALSGGSKKRLQLLTSGLPGLLSALVNIIASVSLFLPTVLRLARRSEVSPRSLLLPMAATALVGANLTLIGAGHNLVVSNLLADAGIGAFGFFEFTLVGVALVTAALLYSLLLGPWLLPEKDDDSGTKATEQPDDLVRIYGLQDRLWEIWVRPESAVIDRSLEEVGIGRNHGLSVLSVLRGSQTHHVHKGQWRLASDDVLLVGGHKDRVQQLLEHTPGLNLRGHPQSLEAFPSSNAELVEVTVPPRSQAAGKTLRDIRFRDATGLTGVALWRDGQPVRTDVRDCPLREGDGLLLFGDRQKTRRFQPAPQFAWTRPPPEEDAPPHLRHLGPWAALILAAVIVVAGIGWMSIATSALAGAAGLVLIGAISPARAYRSVDWRSIVLIAGMYPLGVAMQNSGAAELVSHQLVSLIAPLGPRAVLLAIAALSLFLTQPLHNAAVAVIMTPIAIDAAQAIGANPKAFGVAVVVGASAAFLIPVGHPALLLVQEPGGYKNSDYLKYGSGLAILSLAVVWVLVPLLWPLKAS